MQASGTADEITASTFSTNTARVINKVLQRLEVDSANHDLVFSHVKAFGLQINFQFNQLHSMINSSSPLSNP